MKNKYYQLTLEMPEEAGGKDLNIIRSLIGELREVTAKWSAKLGVQGSPKLKQMCDGESEVQQQPETTMDNRGLKDREKFRKDMLDIMRDQGIMTMGVAFTVPVEGEKPYADFDTFIQDGGVLDNIDSAINQLNTQLNDEKRRQLLEKAGGRELEETVLIIAHTLLEINDAPDDVKIMVIQELYSIYEKVGVLKSLQTLPDGEFKHKATEMVAEHILSTWDDMYPGENPGLMLDKNKQEYTYCYQDGQMYSLVGTVSE